MSKVLHAGRGTLARASWSVVDQSLSSAMGLGLTIVVAHEVDPTAFGAFALALAAYYLSLGVSRALTSDVFVIRFTRNTRSEVRRARGRAAGTALLLGVTLGGAMCLAGLFLDHELRGALVAIGLVLPLLLLQDFMRFSFFAAKRGRRAFTTDVLWACATALLVAVLLDAGVHSAPAFLTAWGTAAGIAALWAMTRQRLTPRPGEAITWLGSQRDLASRFLAEVLLVSGTGALGLFLVSALAGLPAAGALRGAVVLFGPLTVLLTASTLFGVAEAIEADRRSRHALWIFAVQVSAGLAAATALWLGVLLALPDTVGEAILGSTWSGSAPAVPAFGAAMIAAAAMSGAFIGLRALAAARETLRIRALLAPLMLGGMALGAELDGAVGAASAIALANAAGAALAWHAFRRTSQGFRATGPSPTSSPRTARVVGSAATR